MDVDDLIDEVAEKSPLAGHIMLLEAKVEESEENLKKQKAAADGWEQAWGLVHSDLDSLRRRFKVLEDRLALWKLLSIWLAFVAATAFTALTYELFVRR